MKFGQHQGIALCFKNERQDCGPSSFWAEHTENNAFVSSVASGLVPQPHPVFTAPAVFPQCVPHPGFLRLLRTWRNSSLHSWSMLQLFLSTALICLVSFIHSSKCVPCLLTTRNLGWSAYFLSRSLHTQGGDISHVILGLPCVHFFMYMFIYMYLHASMCVCVCRLQVNVWYLL